MTDAIAHVIETVIREEFGEIIQTVTVKEALDYQEDRVFRVTVVFDSNGKLDAKKTTGIIRLIRNRLDQEANGRHMPFPMVSFVSKADAEDAA